MEARNSIDQLCQSAQCFTAQNTACKAIGSWRRRGSPRSGCPVRHISACVEAALAAQAVISVDTKKKELVGNYVNAGQQWASGQTTPEGQGARLPGPEVPRAFPYGIYDLGRNEGFVNVGTDHDTGAFAVASIGGWWRCEGRHLYPEADTLLITADGGAAMVRDCGSGN